MDRRWFVAVAVVVLIVPPAATAQESEPQATRAAQSITALMTYFPEDVTGAFGDGWTAIRRGRDTSLPDGGAVGYRTYGGPAGARISAWVRIPAPTPAGVADAWEDALSEYDDRHRAVHGDSTFPNLHPPPNGDLTCADARRTAGPSPLDGIYVGMTLCAIATQAFIFALVSGNEGDVLGGGGLYASDRVVLTLVATAQIQSAVG